MHWHTSAGWATRLASSQSTVPPARTGVDWRGGLNADGDARHSVHEPCHLEGALHANDAWNCNTGSESFGQGSPQPGMCISVGGGGVRRSIHQDFGETQGSGMVLSPPPWGGGGCRTASRPPGHRCNTQYTSMGWGFKLWEHMCSLFTVVVHSRCHLHTAHTHKEILYCASGGAVMKRKKKTRSVQYTLRWRPVGNRWRLVGNRWRLVWPMVVGG